MKQANGKSRGLVSKTWLGLVLSSFMLLATTSVQAQQTHFPTPESAANHLVLAVARADTEALQAMLGEDYRQLLPVEDIEQADVERFFDAWAEFHVVAPTAPDTRMLAVGENGWKLPIPIVRDGQGWRFDTVQGGGLMRIQRIGRNELGAMQAALAYRDAQMEYAMADHDGDGVLEFAQRFKSTPGKRDGLYWEAAEGEPPSPLGPLFEGRLPEKAYHGYLYKILTAQGEQAPGGALDYRVDGQMRRGFALLAWPAEYGRSGVMSFMLNRNGLLYEADLGPNGTDVAESMDNFNPDAQWKPVLPEFTTL